MNESIYKCEHKSLHSSICNISEFASFAWLFFDIRLLKKITEWINEWMTDISLKIIQNSFKMPIVVEIVCSKFIEFSSVLHKFHSFIFQQKWGRVYWIDFNIAMFNVCLCLCAYSYCILRTASAIRSCKRVIRNTRQWLPYWWFYRLFFVIVFLRKKLKRMQGATFVCCW